MSPEASCLSTQICYSNNGGLTRCIFGYAVNMSAKEATFKNAV